MEGSLYRVSTVREKVREKHIFSGNFEIGQGNFKIKQKDGEF